MTDWDAAFAPAPTQALSAVEGQGQDEMPKAPGDDWEAAFAPTPVGPQSAVEMPPMDRQEGFIERTMDNAGEGISNAYGDYFEGMGKGNPIAGAVHGGGEIVDAVGKVAGDAYDTFAPKVVKDTVKSVGKAVTDTDLYKGGVELLKDAQQSYQSWKKENPELGETTDDALEYMGDATKIGTLMAPGPKVGPTLKIPGKPSLSRQLTRANKEAVKATRREKVLKMIEPADKKGMGNIDIDRRGKHVYQPHPWEQEVADEIVKIKDLKPNAPAARNHNVLRNEATKLREQLEGRIAKVGNPKIDKVALLTKMDDVAENLTDMPGGFALVGDSATSAKNMMIELRRIMEKSDGTALGVLQARRDFDAAIRKAYGDVYNSSTEQAKHVANKWIRDTLNETVDDAVKGTDVLKNLQRQHKLLYAADEVLAKAHKERATTMGRLVDNIENKIGMKIPTTPLALGSTAVVGAGVLAGTPVAAATAATLTGLFAGYKGIAWLGSPPGRQWIIKMVKAIESDPMLLKTLKADRLALLAMLDEPKDEEE